MGVVSGHIVRYYVCAYICLPGLFYLRLLFDCYSAFERTASTYPLLRY